MSLKISGKPGAVQTVELGGDGEPSDLVMGLYGDAPINAGDLFQWSVDNPRVPPTYGVAAEVIALGVAGFGNPKLSEMNHEDLRWFEDPAWWSSQIARHAARNQRVQQKLVEKSAEVATVGGKTKARLESQISSLRESMKATEDGIELLHMTAETGSFVAVFREILAVREQTEHQLAKVHRTFVAIEKEMTAYPTETPMAPETWQAAIDQLSAIAIEDATIRYPKDKSGVPEFGRYIPEPYRKTHTVWESFSKLADRVLLEDGLDHLAAGRPSAIEILTESDLAKLRFAEKTHRLGGPRDKLQSEDDLFEDQELLIQLSSDNATRFGFGDPAVWYGFIRREDLEQRNFSDLEWRFETS